MLDDLFKIKHLGSVKYFLRIIEVLSIQEWNIVVLIFEKKYALDLI